MAHANRRRLVFHGLAEVRNDIYHLQSSSYQRAGNWSLGQACDHLAKSFNAMIDGYGFQAAWPMRTLARVSMPFVFRVKRVPSGTKIPQRFEPAADISDAQGIAMFLAAVERVKSYSGNFARHPYLGAITRQQWQQVQLIHCAHHLGFLIPKGHE